MNDFLVCMIIVLLSVGALLASFQNWKRKEEEKNKK